MEAKGGVYGAWRTAVALLELKFKGIPPENFGNLAR